MYEVLPPGGFDLHFLDESDVEHFFIHLLVIFMALWRAAYSDSLPIFIRMICFLLYQFLINLDVNLNKWFENIFLIILLIVSFTVQSFIIWYNPTYLFFKRFI